MYRSTLRPVALAFTLLAAAMGVVAGPDPAGAAATKTVTYAGYQVEVPQSWPVYRLEDQPERCVRFDRHAVYLGRPGAAQNCPAHVVGRTEALVIEQLVPDRVEPDAVRSPEALPTTTDREVQVVVEDAGVLVTASYSTDKATVQDIVASAELTSAARPAPLPDAGVAPSDPSPLAADGVAVAEVGGAKWAGEGFDACTAPSVGAMRAWMDHSPFGAANIYIGGVARACSQPNLTAAWVDTVRDQGWVLIPTYVGLQAPCTSFGNRIDPNRAWDQGLNAANDAVAKASGLGIGPGAPIYFDMEGYNNTIQSCSDAVMTFLDAWTVRLHEHGYLSGVYSSSSSGMADLVRYAPHINDPDDIWFARWNLQRTLFGDPAIPDSMWANRQRIHQYHGDHNETHGGVTINIDSNVLDADVAGGPGSGPGRVFVDTFADAPGFDAPGGTRTGTLNRGTSYVYCRVWGPEVRDGDSYNHWWLRTDLDTGQTNHWISALYLSRWGNDEARDNNGADIVDCNEPYGAIGTKWRSLGGINSVVGPPKLPELDAQLGGRFQEFHTGIIIWHPDTDAHPIYGAVLAHYWNTGSETTWGFPTIDEAAAANGGRYQYTQHALFMWHPDTGAHAIHGAIHDAFATNGRETTLGYPTSDETTHPDGNGVHQTYQHATIHWTPQQGTWITR